MAGYLPHITWCLTGLLTFLPLHPAGLYATPDEPKIFDYVVSSYTPTLAALLSARRPPSTPGNDAQRDRNSTLLAITQPGRNSLPGTVDESTRFHMTRLDDREATIATVLRE